eukprot:g12138.t1
MWQRFKRFFSREDDEAEKARQERAKPKPRQDWLVAVGQGHSPARTLRRESRGPGSKPRRKKFDTARLSFGGLEQEQDPRPLRSPLPSDDGTDAREPFSPPTTPSPRQRRSRPCFSPASTASSRASPTRHPSTATSQRSLAGDGSPGGRRGSPSRRSPAKALTSPREGDLKTDWLSVAKSGNRSNISSGGDGDSDALAAAAAAERSNANDDGNGGSPADAKLNSLLVLSPGKEYWAGRLAAKGPRESLESPQTTAGKTAAGGGVDAAICSPREVSPLKYPARKERNMALRYAGRRQQQQQEGSRGNGASTVGSLTGSMKEFSSFRAGKRGASLSPEYGGGAVGGDGGGTTTSAWSAEASTRGSSSPNGRGVANPSPWRNLQKGEVWSPSSRQVSPSTVSWSPMKGQRRRDFSLASARVAREDATAPVAAAAPASAAAYLPSAKQKGGAASLSLSPTALGAGFRTSPASRFISRRESVGASFAGGGRSLSPLQRQTSRDPLASRPGPGPLVSGYSGSNRGRPLARERVTSPSSLPTSGLFKRFSRDRGSGSGSLRDSGSPERTMKGPGNGKRESPERTGEATSSDDDDVIAATAAGRGKGAAGANALGGEAQLVVEDPNESEEAAVRSKRNRCKTTAATKKEEGTALAIPPATEKHFIGFLPEEFCAPFRLLFQLFAVAGWP